MKLVQELDIPKSQIEAAVKKHIQSLERKISSLEKKLQTRDNKILKLEAQHQVALAEAKQKGLETVMPEEFGPFLQVLSEYVQVCIETEKRYDY